VPDSDFYKEESMKSQATVRSITRKPNAGPLSAKTINITIDQHGKPTAPEVTHVVTGQEVTWECTSSSITGTLTVCFDPFHAVVFATGTGGGIGDPFFSLGSYTVMTEQPATGQPGKQFHYHIVWSDAVHGTHGVDPIIIVDATN
jgi:hypothetical protein